MDINANQILIFCSFLISKRNIVISPWWANNFDGTVDSGGPSGEVSGV